MRGPVFCFPEVAVAQRKSIELWARRCRFDPDRPPQVKRPERAPQATMSVATPPGGAAAMSTEIDSSTTAVMAEQTARGADAQHELPRVTKPGRVPIKSWVIDLEGSALEQAT